MTKRYLAIWLAAALFLALAGVPATAQSTSHGDMPVNPYYQRANHPPTINTFKRFQMYLATARINLTNDGGDYYDGGRTWTASITGSTDEYTYEFYLIDPNDRFGSSNVHSYQMGDSNTFSYVFMVPGTYQLQCWAASKTDPSAPEIYKGVNFTVSANGHATTDQLVADIVAQCRADGCTGDFETALWLHDWMIDHARYDYTYSYYSADSILARGTGVCDGYSKAYVLLLEAAGIDVDRVTGGDHAWNIAKLDGEWYQIDATWDDPYYSEGPVSGWENHIYFGLTDALMRVDHDYTPATPCTHLEDNYFIRTGRVSIWIDDLDGDVQNALGRSLIRHAVSLPDWYDIERDGYSDQGMEHVVYTLSAYAMSRMGWSADGEAISLGFDYDIGGKILTYEMVIPEEDTLALPAGLSELGEEALRNGDFMAVEIPGGVAAIPAGALADNARLWKVTIPATVTDIDDTAFDNCPHLNIACPSGSAAMEYAINHGINYCVE